MDAFARIVQAKNNFNFFKKIFFFDLLITDHQWNAGFCVTFNGDAFALNKRTMRSILTDPHCD